MSSAVASFPDLLSLQGDVAISAPANRQSLLFDFASGFWINSAVTKSDLGLGTVATHAYAEFDLAGAAAAVAASLATHVANVANPHGVTKSQLGLGNVENTALSTWAGTTNLTTLGTVGAGIWHGSAIGVLYGGTGATTASGARTNLGLGTAAVLNADNSANNLPLLNSLGQLATSVLPPLSISSTQVVASQAAMLALTAEQGDVAVRSDTSKTYILAGSDPTVLGNWQELLGAGEAPVQSVSGRVGTVVLTSTDVGLSAVENTALSTWAGTSNITTLGTVGAGLWHGTKIAQAYGGTNADLSATGPGFLRQATSGAAVSVGGVVVGDLPSTVALLPGQAGGQTINGDTASGGNLTLVSTAHATKGKILFGTSAYDEVNNRLGLGTSSPIAGAVLTASSIASSASTLDLFTSSTDQRVRWDGNTLSALSSVSGGAYGVFAASQYGVPTGAIVLYNSGLQIGTSAIIDFGSGGAYSSSKDTRLVRPSVGSLYLTDANAGNSVSFILARKSTTTNQREMAGLSASAVDNTDATRKYRLTLSAYDTAAREGLRIVSNGSAALTGIGSTGADPLNTADIFGSVSIGASYAGVVTAPANGMVVQGQAAFGTATAIANTRLTVASGGDGFSALRLQRNSSSQNADLFQIVDSDGSTVLGSWNKNARVLTTPTRFAMGPGATEPSADQQIVFGNSNVATSSSGNCFAFGAGNTISETAYGSAFGSSNTISGTSVYGAAFGTGNTISSVQFGVVVGNSNTITGNQSAAIGLVNTVSGNNSVALGTLCNVSGNGVLCFGGYTNNPTFKLQRYTSDSVLRDVADMAASWVTATDAGRKSRLALFAYDTAARECVRMEASGTSPMLGFFGASAVVQQSIASAATDLASAITLANDLRTAIRNLGFAA